MASNNVRCSGYGQQHTHRIRSSGLRAFALIAEFIKKGRFKMCTREHLERMDKEDIINLFLSQNGNVTKEIFVDNNGVEETCFGCPTIFEFSDIDGDNYCFWLRGGSWVLENNTGDVTICFGHADQGIDGVCSWNDAKRMMSKEGCIICE